MGTCNTIRTRFGRAGTGVESGVPHGVPVIRIILHLGIYSGSQFLELAMHLSYIPNLSSTIWSCLEYPKKTRMLTAPMYV